MAEDKKIRFLRMPDEYWEPASKKGRVERLVYKAESLDDESREIVKSVYVYLPYDYDENISYDILYYVHGAGSPVENLLNDIYDTEFCNVLDNMIQHGDIKPLIVAAPTFYQEGHHIDSEVTVCWQLADMLADEIYEMVMPAVESRYNSFADTVDEEGFSASRTHRAIGGFSMGGVVMWYVFQRHLNAFSVFLPQSGDSWFNGMHSGSRHCEEDAADLVNAVRKSGYAPEDFSIYMMTGTGDNAYPHLIVQSEAMKVHSEIFKFSDTFGEGNFYFNIAFNGIHWYDFAYEYLFNALPLYFPNTEN
ncbi:MAG: alpha/beta hydrolase [Anaerovoracaceae bacterium]